MKKYALAAVATLSAFAAAPAAQAAIVDCRPTFGAGALIDDCQFGGDNAVFFEIGTTGGAFTSSFEFDFDADGTVASDIITLGLSNALGITFTSVLFDSTPFTLTSSTAASQTYVLLPPQQVLGPSTHTITLMGTAAVKGQYTGNLNVGPPIPEPAVWSMMLLGFGAIGYSLRRRPRYRMIQAV